MVGVVADEDFPDNKSQITDSVLVVMILRELGETRLNNFNYNLIIF